MRKKTIWIGGLLAFVLLFTFQYRRVNASYPKKSEIKTYDMEDKVKLGNVEVKVLDRYIKNFEGHDYLGVDLEYTNKSKDLNIASSNLLPKFYQNFATSIPQNMIERGNEDELFDQAYHLEDLDLEKNSSKEITIYFQLDKEGNYFNNLLLNGEYYSEIRQDKYDDGILYYEVIDLGDVYD